MLDDRISNILEKLENFRTKMYILWKTTQFWRRKIRLSAKEKVNEIKIKRRS